MLNSLQLRAPLGGNVGQSVCVCVCAVRTREWRLWWASHLLAEDGSSPDESDASKITFSLCCLWREPQHCGLAVGAAVRAGCEAMCLSARTHHCQGSLMCTVYLSLSPWKHAHTQFKKCLRRVLRVLLFGHARYTSCSPVTVHAPSVSMGGGASCGIDVVRPQAGTAMCR